MLTPEKIKSAIAWCEREISYYRITASIEGLNEMQQENMNEFITALEALKQIQKGV